MEIKLIGVSRDSIIEALSVEMTDQQRFYCAPPSYCMAEMNFVPDTVCHLVRYREATVGFVNLRFKHPKEDDLLVWRLIIDRRYQSQGYGGMTLDVLKTFAKGSLPMKKRLVTYIRRGPHNPYPFWEQNGFEYTGREHNDHDEVVFNLIES